MIEVKENKRLESNWGENIVKVECILLIDDYSENNVDKFLEELKNLIDKFDVD